MSASLFTVHRCFDGVLEVVQLLQLELLALEEERRRAVDAELLPRVEVELDSFERGRICDGGVVRGHVQADLLGETTEEISAGFLSLAPLRLRLEQPVVHLLQPILLGGAPRTVAIANGTLAAAVGLGLQLWIPGLVLWIVGHSLAVWGARVDPQFMQVFARHIKHKPLLDV